MRIETKSAFQAASRGVLAIAILTAVGVAGCQPSKPSRQSATKSPPTTESEADVPKEEIAPPTSDTPHSEPPDPMPPGAETPAAEAPANAPKTEAHPPVPATAAEVTAETGPQLYARHCAACHGDKGDGRGLATQYLFPKPRDFRAGKFRLVSTDNNVPTEADLEAVLLRGMPGSAMPPWGHLSQADRKALVAEVLRLFREGMGENYAAVLREQEGLTDEELKDPEIQAEIQEFVVRRTTPGQVTAVPEINEPDAEALARGKAVYFKQSCQSCHGNEGKGDGTQKMLDDEGFATAARDYTKGIFKGGHDVASLYRRIAYGMPGTPMPGSKQLTPAEMVDLTHFIRSMSTEDARLATILRREKIVVKALDAIPESSDTAGWAAIAPVSLRAVPLWWRNDADPDLQVQAAHDGTTIALRLSWRDEYQDGHAAKTESFEDAVAMELYRGNAEPFLGMGIMKSAVDVWFWDADRQGPLMTVEKAYPNTVVDNFPFSEKVSVSAELDRDGARTADQPDVSLPARAVGNQIVPTGSASGASSLTAGGPGTATFRIPQSQLVKAQGEWKDGRWTVLMTRALAVASEDDGVALAPGQRVSAAFAVWDGALRDRDGKKLITIWQDLELESKP